MLLMSDGLRPSSRPPQPLTVRVQMATASVALRQPPRQVGRYRSGRSAPDSSRSECLVTARDEDHHATGAEQRPFLPVSVRMLDREPGVSQCIAQLFKTTKTQVALGDHHLSGE